MGLALSPEDPYGDEFRQRASEFVEIIFHLLEPHTVALFVPSERELRLAAIRSRQSNVCRPGYRVSLSDTSIVQVLNDIGEIWVRELSDHAHGWIPVYLDEAPVRSMRVVLVPVEPVGRLLLLIDYADSPEDDPLDKIEPILGLFADSIECMYGGLSPNQGTMDIPIPIFLRRILTPFLDFILGAVPIESLGLVIWSPPASGKKIIEVIGERIDTSAEREDGSFDVEPFRFRWSMGGLRSVSSHNKGVEEGARYYPIVVGGDAVGNLSIVSSWPEFDLKFPESLVRVLSWSMQRELKLIAGISTWEGGTGLPNHNPYRAVIRVLDEWSNASRYNEYLSLGLVKVQIEGLRTGPDQWGDVDLMDNRLWTEVEEILRKGDILVHCSRGNMALIFPRTSPEGADIALRRMRNLLEGRKLHIGDSSVRIRSAEYSVLCYPMDLPTEEIVLEKCSHAFLP